LQVEPAFDRRVQIDREEDRLIDVGSTITGAVIVKLAVSSLSMMSTEVGFVAPA